MKTYLLSRVLMGDTSDEAIAALESEPSTRWSAFDQAAPTWDATMARATDDPRVLALRRLARPVESDTLRPVHADAVNRARTDERAWLRLVLEEAHARVRQQPVESVESMRLASRWVREQRPMDADLATVSHAYLTFAHLAAGQQSEARAAAAALRNWLPRATDPEAQVCGAEALADLLHRDGRSEAALELLDEAAAMLADDPRRQVETVLRQVSIHFVAERPNRAYRLLTALDDRLERGEATLPPRLRLEVDHRLAMIELEQGEPHRALARLVAMETAYDASGAIELGLQRWWLIGLAHRDIGQLDDAVAPLEQALDGYLDQHAHDAAFSVFFDLVIVQVKRRDADGLADLEPAFNRLRHTDELRWEMARALRGLIEAAEEEDVPVPMLRRMLEALDADDRRHRH
ncbi:MAG: hypothetical protein AAGD38_19395 [Acidobacteriota bacterium]